MLAELLGQLGNAFLEGGKPGAGVALQLGARQHEIADRMVQRLAARRVQVLAAGSQGLVLGIQPLIGPQPGVELGHPGQVGVVGFAQFGRVGHGIEVVDRAPGARQPLQRHVQHRRQRVVVGRHGGADGALQRGVGVGQQHIQGRCQVLGPDGGELGQRGGGEQGVVHGVAFLRRGQRAQSIRWWRVPQIPGC